MADKFNEVAAIDFKNILDKKADEISDKNNLYQLTPEEFSNIEGRFDAVFLISVIHTVPSTEERINIVDNIYKALNPNGYFLFDVPQCETYYSRLKDKKYKDGYLMCRGKEKYSFYKNFKKSEVDELLFGSGLFRPAKPSFYQHKHIIRLSQKN